MKLHEIAVLQHNLNEGWSFPFELPVTIEQFNKQMKPHGAVITHAAHDIYVLHYKGLELELTGDNRGGINWAVGRAGSPETELIYNEPMWKEFLQLMKSTYGDKFHSDPDEEDDDVGYPSDIDPDDPAEIIDFKDIPHKH